MKIEKINTLRFFLHCAAGFLAALAISFRQFAYAFGDLKHFIIYYPESDAPFDIFFNSARQAAKQLLTLAVIFSVMFFFAHRLVIFVKKRTPPETYRDFLRIAVFCVTCFVFSLLGKFAANAYSTPEVLLLVIFLVLPGVLVSYIFLYMKFFGSSIHDKNTIRTVIYCAIWLVLFFIGGSAINDYRLRFSLPVFNTLGAAGIILLAIFLGWHSLKPRKKIVLPSGILAFALAMSSLFYLDSRLNASVLPTTKESLGALPYVSWVSSREGDSKKTGVTKYKSQEASDGINIFYSDIVTDAQLIDMRGNTVHTFRDNTGRKWIWKFMKPYLGGDFLVLIGDKALFRIARDSTLKWLLEKRLHHYLDVSESGDIYVLGNKKIYSPRYYLWSPIIDNMIGVITPDGNPKGKEISLARMILEEKELLRAAKMQKGKASTYGRGAWDIFHTNTVQLIKKNIFRNGELLFKKGNLLITIRRLDAIAVVDTEKEEIVWHWGVGELDKPHNALLLDNGNISIFDNGTGRKYSRVIELNPVTETIEWEYKASPLKKFFSKTRGAAQKLPNGNVLITESDRGRVFEITREGKTVWEFFNPHLSKKKEKRAAISNMSRIER
jgi:hypothetical protein